MTEATTTVLDDWHRAVNEGDVDSAVGLCSDDVAVAGPRGVGHGQDLVRAWLLRSGIRLEPLEPFVERDQQVVVRERARWTNAGAGGPSEPVDTWCVFSVADGRVTSIARYETEKDVPPA